MTDIRQVLAKNMKNYRKQQGLSQAKLAQQINTAVTYIAMIETGKKFPSAGMLERIAHALNVDTHELFAKQQVMFLHDDMSVKLLYEQILNDVQQLEKTIIKKLNKFQYH